MVTHKLGFFLRLDLPGGDTTTGVCCGSVLSPTFLGTNAGLCCSCVVAAPELIPLPSEIPLSKVNCERVNTLSSD